MTAYDLKVLGKKITEQAAFSRLMAIKDTKTKMDDTSYVKQFYMPPISPCPDKWTKQWPLDQLTRKIPNVPTPPSFASLIQ